MDDTTGEMKALEREAEQLRDEVRRLKSEIIYKDHNIALLTQINANMHATLKMDEVYFIFLTAVTSGAGLGYNRAMLFTLDCDTGMMSGRLAISPDSEDEMHRFYEEVEQKHFDFSFYIDQFYKQNLMVRNNLNTRVQSIQTSLHVTNLLTETLAIRRPRIVSEYPAEAFEGIPELAGAFQGEAAFIPLYCKNEDIGVLVADNYYTSRAVPRDGLSALETLAGFSSSMILATRKYEEAEQNTIIDDLTKLHNMRFIRQRIDEEVKRAQRYKRIFSLIMIDIDHFKNFNDRNGHLAGNKALMDLASLFRENLRTVDISARFGGEEFILVLPETDKAGAAVATRKLLQLTNDKRFIGGSSQPGGRFTFSAGVSVYPEDGNSYEELVGCADRRLYLAKANGKNQVVDIG